LTTEKLNQYSYEICRHHHERYDGTGYPDGLKGEDIPLSAQVVGLVDAYDALISVRPYKKKLEHDQAVQMILNGECGKFSDELLHCFKKVSSQNNWIKRSERKAV
uniref:HD-GYP domain-containing protein n=1 Tax=Holdemanella biformis TaxID=1735 RepID=UPI002FD9BF3A